LGALTYEAETNCSTSAQSIQFNQSSLISQSIWNGTRQCLKPWSIADPLRLVLSFDLPDDAQSHCSKASPSQHQSWLLLALPTAIPF
jgi:hypothetical protein